MSISGEHYPITVNGFNCVNGGDAGLAAKRIDPSHPASGPDDIRAAQDMTRSLVEREKFAEDDAVARPTIVDSAAYSRSGGVVEPSEPGSVLNVAA